MKHGMEGERRDDLPYWWGCGEQERSRAFRGDPGEHVLVQVPGGDQANTFILEDRLRDGGVSSLSLERLRPLEVQEDSLFAWFDV